MAEKERERERMRHNYRKRNERERERTIEMVINYVSHLITFWMRLHLQIIDANFPELLLDRVDLGLHILKIHNFFKAKKLDKMKMYLYDFLFYLRNLVQNRSWFLSTALELCNIHHKNV